MRLLKDDVILLAGVTGRIGGPILRAALREGASVALVSRSAQNAAKTIAEFGADTPERIAVVAADLHEPAGAERAVRETVERFGRLDGVANASGSGKFVALTDSTLDDLRQNFEGHAVTNYNLMLAALRRMLAQPFREGKHSRGRLIAVTAGSSKTPQPRFGLMGAAKAGVNILMLAIAREHKADGIVSNALVLGTVATEAAREYLDGPDFAAASTPEEVAEALVFHLSDRSRGINGALIDHNAREVD
ncbi:MAG TPA: SDR family oxidoreductase [Candidatus Baltobacteraceae bacterium]|nr:SDR family oxidoreductase [Candidatus Baltobacteraceae bacterium]